MNSGYHPKSFWVDCWRTIARGDVWRAEVLNRGKKGNLYWVDSFIYPFKDEAGQVTGYFSIRNDITKRKQHEMQISRKNELLNRIAWTQSHELRGPVASIAGLINIFDKTFSDAELNQQVLNNMEKVVKQLDEKIKLVVRLTEEIDQDMQSTGHSHYARVPVSPQRHANSV